MRGAWFILWLAAGLPALAGACGTSAKGVDDCRRIEEARCRAARRCPELGIDTDAKVESCVRFYRDQCLHGLAADRSPGGPEIDKCAKAIESGTCDVVRAPETAAECRFLGPAPAEAGADAAAGDAGTDAPTPD